ncbi:MAG: AbrB/MazE/SpoVT family DNA-binding domain-containing protein [Clostridiales bacterium]|nr:AbrB/MazE/SpoVT family DNA-binding domain-containing protein [Clostridiales bacterium]
MKNRNMTRRKIEDRNIRKVFKSGSSYALTIPLEIVDNLKIRKGQKLVVKKVGSKIIIEDWE